MWSRNRQQRVGSSVGFGSGVNVCSCFTCLGGRDYKLMYLTSHYSFLFYSNALAKRRRQDEATVLVLSGPQTDHSLSAGETIDGRKHQTL